MSWISKQLITPTHFVYLIRNQSLGQLGRMAYYGAALCSTSVDANVQPITNLGPIFVRSNESTSTGGLPRSFCGTRFAYPILIALSLRAFSTVSMRHDCPFWL
ncbi:hypothetical protein HO173_012038 [Letharia columbiana]|uniref:Uncharacterized protein n=1 Tax=Letharia columbiana TaxID=112416 RepID=A0A8H6CQI5_9LECA|nr:uncharacterized protein HO173_012038 [Letharia columbiana]KAF6227708.1 hypothetical protein HO173_012038 [Letharia columbiana]